MSTISFIKNHRTLTVCTFGLSIIGYLGYRSVCKLYNCYRAKKITQAGLKGLSYGKSLGTGKPEWKTVLNKWSGRANEANRLKFLYKAIVVQKKYQKIAKNQGIYHQPAGDVRWIPGGFGLWMPGVAFVASRLAEKKNVQGLFVCETLESFATKLNEVALSPVDQKYAFIIPTVSSGRNAPNFPQHKVTVCVEMKDGELTIALLDARPIGKNSKINPSRLKEDLWDGKFNKQEIAFRAILKGCEGLPTKPRFLHSQVIRERAYGCETYALQDAITFLQDSTFFDRISCSKTDVVKIDKKRKIEIIKELPADYLLGVQSSTFYDELKKKEKASYFQQPLLGRKKTFEEYLDDNLILDNKVLRNHYITKKSFQYLTLVITEMQKLSPKKFEKVVSKTLIT